MDFIVENLEKNICYITINMSRATLKEVEEFKTLVFEKIDMGLKNFIVDLTKCEFIDSTFLGTLVISLKKATSKGGDLRLIGFQPAVETMFDLTRMYRVFDLFRSKDEAIDSFS